MLIVMAMVMPIVQLVVLGYAFGGNVKHLKVGIVDQDHGVPAIKVRELAGAVAGGARTFDVIEYTDPGRALITGNCADIGKVKGPILRGLAARAPYFHNGSAATLRDVVNFYDLRFGIGFTEQQKNDLVNFLKTL